MADKTKVKSVAEAVKRVAKKPKKAEKKTTKTEPKKFSIDQLNEKEELVLATLNGAGSGVRPIITIAELAEQCFKAQGAKQGNSWARNSLRRLVLEGLVEKMDRGKYRIAEPTRRSLAKAA